MTRARMLAVAFTLGALAMSDVVVADAQEKKDPAKKQSYDEKVEIRPYYGGKFLKPVPDVLMYRKTDDKGVTRFWTWTTGIPFASQPAKGAEITDKDGVVWVVEKTSTGTSAHVSTVTKKPVEKKP